MMKGGTVVVDQLLVSKRVTCLAVSVVRASLAPKHNGRQILLLFACLASVECDNTI